MSLQGFDPSEVDSPAEAAAAIGEKIFPLIPGRKIPAVEGGLNAASDDPGVIQWWRDEHQNCNWGLNCGQSGLAVIDIDGEAGEQSWAVLCLTYGDPPATREVKTPHGRHLYFRGLLPSSVSKLGAGLDIRSLGGYVVSPGSVVDGVAYEIVNDAPPAPLPAWIADRLAASTPEPLKAGDFEFDLPANVDLGTQHVSRLLARGDVPQPGERNNRTFKLAAYLGDLGLSESVIEDVMAPWVEAMPEPLDDGELGLIVWSALHNRQNDLGARANDLVMPPEAKDAWTSDGERREAGPVPFRDVLARDVPPVQELIGGLLERGTVTFLAGPGGTHKSRVALQWGLSIDSGRPVFGRAVQPATFLYLSYEDHADEVARRARKIAHRLDLPADCDPGEFWDLSPTRPKLAIVREGGAIEEQPFLHRLREHLRSIRGHKFVLIDSTYNALQFEGQAKINEGSVMAAIGLLQRLCDETDSTIMALWHPSQAGQDRGDNAGWSVAWHNAPRSRLSLTAIERIEDAFELKVEKRNHGAKGKPITLHWSDGVLLPLGESAEGDQRSLIIRSAARVACMAAEHGAPLTMQRHLNKWQLDEIEREIGRRPAQRDAKDALASALLQGLLHYERSTRHRAAGYYPPDPEQAALLAREARRGQEGAKPGAKPGARPDPF